MYVCMYVGGHPRARPGRGVPPQNFSHLDGPKDRVRVGFVGPVGRVCWPLRPLRGRVLGVRALGSVFLPHHLTPIGHHLIGHD